MLEAQRSGQPRPTTPFHPAISISDDGLVCGAGSTLVRMARTGSSPRLMVEGDTARLVAMLSVAFNRRVSAAEIVPHVSAAAEHWARGDKAVANFRLTFARLPRLRDAADAERLRLAECALDHGLSPDALMKELGFAAVSTDLRRYREDQPRVPPASAIRADAGRTIRRSRRHRTVGRASRKSFPTKTKRTSRQDGSEARRPARKTSSTVAVARSTRQDCRVALEWVLMRASRSLQGPDQGRQRRKRQRTHQGVQIWLPHMRDERSRYS